MNRREFLKLSAATTAGASLSGYSLTTQAATGKIYFGFDNRDAGSLLGSSAVRVFNEITSRSYDFVNLPGRDTFEAADSFLAAAPDGLSILQLHSASANMLPLLHSRTPYDPLVALSPLGILGEYTIALTVGPAVDDAVDTLDELMDWVIENPSYRYVGFTQHGSPGHIAQLKLARSKRIALLPQAYRDTSMLTQDLKDRTLAIGMVSTGSAQDLFANGLLRPIAVTSKFRHPAIGWEQIPSMYELGLKEFDISGWYGWFISSLTSGTIRRELYNNMQNMLFDPDYENLILARQFKPVVAHNVMIADRIRNELSRNRSYIKDYKIGRIG
jgi:tripartite-type tricarboxylate transporter receptor subunit TctC